MDIKLVDAVVHGDLEIVHRLLISGGNVHATNENGVTLLLCAIFTVNANMVSLLLQYGASMSTSSIDGITALHWAIILGNETVFEELLSKCTVDDLNALDNDGDTPQRVAELMQYGTVVDLLREKMQNVKSQITEC